jgi:hypothetical protein
LRRASTATITLPEPSALAGLASGVALLMVLTVRIGDHRRKLGTVPASTP